MPGPDTVVPERSRWCGPGAREHRSTRPGWSRPSSCAGGAARAPAGKRLAPMLPVLVPLLRRDGELDLTDDEADLLVVMSAATIDRCLAGAKVLAGFRATSHTKPGSLLKTQIPIRTWSEWDDVTPGFVEIDLVGHEGGNPFGEICFTLTMTDIVTGWTVDRSMANKPVVPSRSRSSGSTRTTAASSSTPTSSSGAPHARSPSPVPDPATRTTAATSSRRTGPTSANWSATCGSTPTPYWHC